MKLCQRFHTKFAGSGDAEKAKDNTVFDFKQMGLFLICQGM